MDERAFGCVILFWVLFILAIGIMLGIAFSS